MYFSKTFDLDVYVFSKSKKSSKYFFLKIFIEMKIALFFHREDWYKICSNFSKKYIVLIKLKTFEAETTRLSNAPKNIKNEAITEKLSCKSLGVGYNSGTHFSFALVQKDLPTIFGC